MKTILILIDNFYPAYKGGGPIQSITNLILWLENEYNIYITTSAYDLQSKVSMQGIKINTWNEVLLPHCYKSVKIWYSEKGEPGYRTFKKILQQSNPDIIYMNGIFSYNFFMIPLLVIKNIRNRSKMIVCPRGMLQKGAVADKAFKKRIYLKALKYSGLVNKAVWHATNQEEKEDVLKYFKKNKGIITAINIPKKPVEKISCIEKTPGNLKLVYLSLITEKKNLLFLLQLIKATVNITLDIYGPVKDNAYWNKCTKVIDEMPGKVKYFGSISPLQVQDTFGNYHSSILLTKGENFGHSLYESLSVGRPVITSYFTPWNNLQQQYAGWNVNISDFAECVKWLNKIKELDQLEFSKFCIGAHDIANKYFKKSIDLDNYRRLF